MITWKRSKDTGPEDNPNWEVSAVDYKSFGEAKRELRKFLLKRFGQEFPLKRNSDNVPFCYVPGNLLF